MLEKLQEMVWQLQRLPGGAAAAIPDFFAPLMAGPEERSEQSLTCWPLREGGSICLGPAAGGSALLLDYRVPAQTQAIAELPADLLRAARHDADDPASPYAVSPLVLGLLAIAAGDIDDGLRLKRLLPKVDAAAKDLMLMTVCRLCG